MTFAIFATGTFFLLMPLRLGFPREPVYTKDEYKRLCRPGGRVSALARRRARPTIIVRDEALRALRAQHNR